MSDGRVIVVSFNKAEPGKYRVNLVTGEWGPVQESKITTDNIRGPHFPSIPFGYFLKERPAYNISGELMGTLESQLELFPDQGRAMKRLFFNGEQVRYDKLDTIRFKPTDEFLDVIVMDENTLKSRST